MVPGVAGVSTSVGPVRPALASRAADPTDAVLASFSPRLRAAIGSDTPYDSARRRASRDEDDERDDEDDVRRPVTNFTTLVAELQNTV